MTTREFLLAVAVAIITGIAGPLLIKRYDQWRESKKLNADADKTLSLSDRKELREVRLRVERECDKLKAALSDVQRDLMAKDIRIIRLEYELEAEKRRVADKNEEIALLRKSASQ
jgi:hypothetical protein